MPRLIPLLMSVTAIASLSVANAADKTDATAVVKKGIEFLGGEKNLKKFKAATWKDKGTYYGMGDGLAYTGKFATVWPGKFRMEILGVFTQVLNVDSGWVNSMGNVKDMTKKQVAAQQQSQHETFVGQLYPLLDGKKYKLTLDGKAEVNGGKAAIVKVKSKGNRDIRLFFNPKTGELVKSEFMATPADLSDKLVKQETYFKAYRAVKGIKYASKIRIMRGGKKYIETTITEYKPLDSLPEKTFAKPK